MKAVVPSNQTHLVVRRTSELPICHGVASLLVMLEMPNVTLCKADCIHDTAMQLTVTEVL